MKRSGLFALLSVLVFAGCAGSSGPTTSTGEGELGGTERGFAYECTTEKMFISAATTKVVVTKNHLSFEGDWGPNVGARDDSYHAPAGKQRVRFDGYETGEDCEMQVVADQAVIDGKPTGEVRIQCAGDGFQQEVLSCSKPKPASYQSPAPVQPEPQNQAPVPPDSTKKWACQTTDSSVFADRLVMQVVDDSIRVVEDGMDHTGTRDRDYHPHSGDWIQYDNVEYGGDCSITLVVEAKALAASPTSTQLKVRCAGDDFVQALYRCTPQ
jgi:hypothetical protein